MGTTLTAAIVNAEREEVAIGHVGDSRAYRLRGRKLEQLTRDHSLVEEMRRKGQITDAQAQDLPGCVAVGETREEVAELIKGAIAMHL